MSRDPIGEFGKPELYTSFGLPREIYEARGLWRAEVPAVGWTAKGTQANLYEYANGDPGNMVDPDGLRPLAPCGVDFACGESQLHLCAEFCSTPEKEEVYYQACVNGCAPNDAVCLFSCSGNVQRMECIRKCHDNPLPPPPPPRGPPPGGCGSSR